MPTPPRPVQSPDIQVRKIDALLSIAEELLEERSTAIDTATEATLENVMKSTDGLLAMIIMAIDGNIDEMVKEADKLLDQPAERTV